MGFKKPTLAQRIFGDKFLGRWESVKDTAEIQAMNFQSSLRQKTKDLKDKLNGVMSSEEVCYDEDVQTRAQALKEQINNLEARIADKAKQMINLFSLGHLFKASPIQGHHMVNSNEKNKKQMKVTHFVFFFFFFSNSINLFWLAILAIVCILLANF